MPAKEFSLNVNAIREGLNRLSHRPFFLFALMFLANAIGIPYSGVVHDAKLYAAQALNAADGRLAGDLFFAYGSQARYTVLPQFLAPICAKFGPYLPFFVCYLASQALWLFAVMRLMLALFDRAAAVMAMLLTAAILTPLAGNAIFFVNEPYFTPRIPAMALCMLAFRSLLNQQNGQAAGLLALALILHPLMTAPAGLVVLGWFAWPKLARMWPFSTAAIFLALAVASVLFLSSGLGHRSLGYLDVEWRGDILRANPYADPLNWTRDDLSRIATTAVFALAWIFWTRDASVRRLLALFLIVGVLGILLAIFSARSSFALLLQGQAYRWIWPLELLRYALAVAVAAHLWKGGSWQRALGICVFGTTLDLGWIWIAFGAVSAAIGGWLSARASKEGTRPSCDWTVWTTAMILVTGTLLKVSGIVFYLLSAPPSFYVNAELANRMLIWVSIPGPAFGLLVSVLLAALIHAVKPLLGWKAALTALVAAFGAHALIYALPRMEWGRTFVSDDADQKFVRDFFGKRGSEQRPLTIYWQGRQVETVWFDLSACSYFNTWQLSGNYFNRGNAVEGQRRAIVVRAFEIDAMRRNPLPYWDEKLEQSPNNIFHCDRNFPPPTLDDFRTLVAEPSIDFVIVPHAFPGLFVATNGSVYLYDCRQLRTP